MLSIIIGDNSVGKSLLLKRIKELIFNPKYLINHFPSTSLQQDNTEYSGVYSKLFLHEDNIARYKDCLNSNEIHQNVDVVKNSVIENVDSKKGFTSELSSSDYKIKEKLLDEFLKENLDCLLRSKVNKKELKILCEKYKRVLIYTKADELGKEDLNRFIRRQLIKKLVYTNLFELLKQDCFYGSEIELINQCLSKRRFPYNIELRNNLTEIKNEADINLIHIQTNFKHTLNKITANERLVLHLYLIERELDLIKIHENVNLNQILLFDEIDNNLDMIHSAELINFIRFNFVKNLNIQCVFTTNNQLTISQCHKHCLLQMSYDNNCKEIMLGTLNSDSVQTQCKELIMANNFKKKIPLLNKALEFQEEKKSRAELILNLNSVLTQNKILENDLTVLRKVSESLMKENQNLKTENLKLKEDKCRLQEHAMTTPNEFNETLDNSNIPRFKTNENLDWRNKLDEIKNKTFEDTTNDELQLFIEYLQMDVDSFEGRAKDIIRNNIELLGPKMYTSQMSFVNELIQNFDDTGYGDNAHPCLRIVLNEKFLLFSSNQMVLQPSEVWSISSIGQSTKIKGQDFFNKYSSSL